MNVGDDWVHRLGRGASTHKNLLSQRNQFSKHLLHIYASVGLIMLLLGPFHVDHFLIWVYISPNQTNVFKLFIEWMSPEKPNPSRFFVFRESTSMVIPLSVLSIMFSAIS